MKNVMLVLLGLFQVLHGFTFRSTTNTLSRLCDSRSSQDIKKNDIIAKTENAPVTKGLTHIKYNKYAPSAEEAKDLTDIQFREFMMKKMKAAEVERRKYGPVGNANSDNYLDNLSRSKTNLDSQDGGAVFMVSEVPQPLSPTALISSLNWRYATKQFDKAFGPLPTDILHAVEESLRLTPSSYGLQPWKFLIVTDASLRATLRTHSYNQSQITDSSHLVVFAGRLSYNNNCDNNTIMYLSVSYPYFLYFSLFFLSLSINLCSLSLSLLVSFYIYS